ncbi:MAG: AbgT family transporter [Proteobacteria bacterium]|nr:AbgT family transporter [Pseudomonadota bacterium]
MSESAERPERSPGWLDRIERLGNALPDPVTLFALGAGTVVLASAAAVFFDWTVLKTTGGAPETLRATSLLSADGVYWLLRNLVKNFVEFPPLGVVLVGMLGIGVAERSGLIGALLKAAMLAVPPSLFTPAVFFVGVMSSIGLDAGYVVLPPLAAALFKAVGRSPVVGLAATFAGVSAGFSANLVVTSLDPLLAEFSTAGAHLVDPDYAVAATANWWFMIASTVALTLLGWGVTAWWVEPRFAALPEEAGGPSPDASGNDVPALTADEKKGLAVAGAVAVLGSIVLAVAVLVPGAPLYGAEGHFPRWVRTIVPLLFLGFWLPGVAYGVATGSVKNDRDVARMMTETLAGMGGYIVLAFFAAQFVAAFQHSGLGEMLAISGGRVLAEAGLSRAFLVVAFIGVVFAGNLFVGSMSAKYAFFAPVVVPMVMQVGISPELTQVAYRIGDSVSNVITPLNPYVVIILTFLQRYAARAGIGTLIATMLPYTLVFGLGWTLMLLVWMATGAELGPGGPLGYGG